MTRVHSAAGCLLPDGVLVSHPPFRAPHHSASLVALVGGGSWSLRPGEISLATHGVLFLDEMGEFPVAALEALRQPLEEGVIRVSRAGGTVAFPAQFLLAAAMNPCPCGEGVFEGACRCTDADRARYRRRLSAPLLDRFDLVVPLARPDPDQLLADPPARPPRSRPPGWPRPVPGPAAGTAPAPASPRCTRGRRAAGGQAAPGRPHRPGSAQGGAGGAHGGRPGRSRAGRRGAHLRCPVPAHRPHGGDPMTRGRGPGACPRRPTRPRWHRCPRWARPRCACCWRPTPPPWPGRGRRSPATSPASGNGTRKRGSRCAGTADRATRPAWRTTPTRPRCSSARGIRKR